VPGRPLRRCWPAVRVRAAGAVPGFRPFSPRLWLPNWPGFQLRSAAPVRCLGRFRPTGEAPRPRREPRFPGPARSGAAWPRSTGGNWSAGRPGPDRHSDDGLHWADTATVLHVLLPPGRWQRKKKNGPPVFCCLTATPFWPLGTRPVHPWRRSAPAAGDLFERSLSTTGTATLYTWPA